MPGGPEDFPDLPHRDRAEEAGPGNADGIRKVQGEGEESGGRPDETGKETFEFLPKPSKSSFLRKQESRPFKVLWIPAFAGMTKEGRFSKVSN